MHIIEFKINNNIQFQTCLKTIKLKDQLIIKKWNLILDFLNGNMILMLVMLHSFNNYLKYIKLFKYVHSSHFMTANKGSIIQFKKEIIITLKVFKVLKI